MLLVDFRWFEAALAILRRNDKILKSIMARVYISENSPSNHDYIIHVMLREGRVPVAKMSRLLYALVKLSMCNSLEYMAAHCFQGNWEEELDMCTIYSKRITPRCLHTLLANMDIENQPITTYWMIYNVYASPHLIDLMDIFVCYISASIFLQNHNLILHRKDLTEKSDIHMRYKKRLHLEIP